MITYIATPYTHKSKAVMQARYEQVNAYSAHLMQQGVIVFSPISHTHPIAVQHSLPVAYEFWQKHCETFVRACGAMHVLAQDGWTCSVGVEAEMRLAKSSGIPIKIIKRDARSGEYKTMAFIHTSKRGDDEYCQENI